MSKFRVRYPPSNDEQDMQFAISEVGTFRNCNFYISSPGFEKSGLAFRVAFDAATKSTNHKNLCTYVGSMICAVSKVLETSVLKALHRVGVEPRFVELLCAHNINEAQVTEIDDWPWILVNFGCMCIFLFIKKNSDEDYKSFMSSCIRELQKRAGHESELHLIFDLSKANAIRTMLGACLSLRETLIKFIMYTMNQGCESIHRVCQCLFNILSWSGMDELILLNEMLVIPQYSALAGNPKEAENLAEACADHSRFPTLIKIAKEKKIEIGRQS